MYVLKRIINFFLVVSQYSPFALIWMLKAFLVDWPLRIWSFSQLPKTAEEMGLVYIKSDYIKEFGTIKGNINGYGIEAKPDDHMVSFIKITAKNKENNLNISLDKPSMRNKKNIGDFKTLNWRFNWTFKTKRAHVKLIEQLSGQNDFFDFLVDFYMEWMFKLDTLFVDHGEVYCKFRYGFNFFPYIPVSKFEDIVNQLVVIAEKYDELLTG